MPEIDTEWFEIALNPKEKKDFERQRPEFVRLVHRLVCELGLKGRIESIKLEVPVQDRAEMYRDSGKAWPWPRLFLAVQKTRYMCEQLLRHELGHERDRWDHEMLYDPAIEERWKKNSVPFDLAENISLDARLGAGGLGKEWSRKDFCHHLGPTHEDLFEELWTAPPMTWPEIERLAERLSGLFQPDA